VSPTFPSLFKSICTLVIVGKVVASMSMQLQVSDATSTFYYTSLV
jgi:hypothetical protein